MCINTETDDTAPFSCEQVRTPVCDEGFRPSCPEGFKYNRENNECVNDDTTQAPTCIASLCASDQRPICPDGTKLDHSSGTCVDDEGVSSGAPDCQDSTALCPDRNTRPACTTEGYTLAPICPDDEDLVCRIKCKGKNKGNGSGSADN